LDSWYRLFEVTTSNDENSYYELKYFNNLSEHVNITRQEANKQLNKLVDLFQKTFKNNFNLVAFKQKYLKSIQEIEIESAIEHLDSNSIIWFQLVLLTTEDFSIVDSLTYVDFDCRLVRLFFIMLKTTVDFVDLIVDEIFRMEKVLIFRMKTINRYFLSLIC
jgi:hypothetical protein